MSQQRLTDRAEVEVVTKDDLIHVVQNGASFKATIEQVKESFSDEFATSEQGDKADSAVQPDVLETAINEIELTPGPQGPQGEQGAKGDKGDIGDTGPQGEQGLKGDTGEQGIQGIQGPVGPIGPVGPQGEQGPKGDKGDPGDPATGDMLTATYDPAGGAKQVAFADEVATAAQGAKADSATQPGHTHIATNITDFDTAVTANSAVAANTAKISFDSASSTKLAGIETGAQVNTVTSVASKTGAVTLVKGDVGLGNVDNTTDLNKPISTATQTALDGKVAGPASATDNAVARYDGTTGKLIEDSSVTILDNGDVGIGTAGPTQKLHIIGDARIEGDLRDVALSGFKITAASVTGTTAINWNNGAFQEVTLTGNTTLTFTAPTGDANNGWRLQLLVKQDATGGRTLALPTVKTPGGAAYTVSGGANAEDILTFYYNGTSYYLVDSKDFS